MIGNLTVTSHARARVHTVPAITVRLLGALLAIAVSVVHVADAGGIAAFSPPHWMAWGYRFIEAGGVLTAIAVLVPWSSLLGWAAAVPLGILPFVGYVASRTVGVPGDHGDIGKWDYWLGTVSLIVEAAIVLLGASMVLSAVRLARPGQSRQARSPS